MCHIARCRFVGPEHRFVEVRRRQRPCGSAATGEMKEVMDVDGWIELRGDNSRLLGQNPHHLYVCCRLFLVYSLYDVLSTLK